MAVKEGTAEGMTVRELVMQMPDKAIQGLHLGGGKYSHSNVRISASSADTVLVVWSDEERGHGNDPMDVILPQNAVDRFLGEWCEMWENDATMLAPA